MKLQVVAKSGVLFEGEVTDVVVPAADGELGILPGHTPLLAVLEPGSVRFTLVTGEKREILTSRGFVTVDSDEVMVVVEFQRNSDN
ncbi:ATP synthase F1 subunit epsilon [Arcanobacterium bovis]|nr:ATP synthase F1 subunit epsilon [Arcanobacterium bovis]